MLVIMNYDFLQEVMGEENNVCMQYYYCSDIFS